MTHKVFVSYARGDRELAKVLGEKMRALGADVFDDQAILPGDDWQKVFREALEAADAVVYLAPNDLSGHDRRQYTRDNEIGGVSRAAASCGRGRWPRF